MWTGFFVELQERTCTSRWSEILLAQRYITLNSCLLFNLRLKILPTTPIIRETDTLSKLIDVSLFNIMPWKVASETQQWHSDYSNDFCGQAFYCWATRKKLHVRMTEILLAQLNIILNNCLSKDIADHAHYKRNWYIFKHSYLFIMPCTKTGQV